MGLLQTLSNDQGFLKAGFLGFPKSGKTFTATELAIGTRNRLGLDGPVAFFDTESGSAYVAKRIEAATGQKPVGLRSRSFDKLLEIGRECVDSGISVLLVDSVTHIWKDVCESYLREVNDFRRSKGWRIQDNLQFQDWAIVKRKWGEWTDFYLNAPLHIVICGRAGFEYDHQENESGKKELVKTGVKMKAESEFGFEPSLLVQMDRVDRDGKPGHQATILGDRFNVIDGQRRIDPGFDFFEPHIAELMPGGVASIDTDSATRFELGQGDDEWAYEQRRRVVLAEEVQGILVDLHPSTSGKDKQAKGELLFRFFGTRSWTKVAKQTPADVLDRKLNDLKAHYYTIKPPVEMSDDGEDAPSVSLKDAVAEACGEDDVSF